MSRTYAHAPQDVEIQRAAPELIRVRHLHFCSSFTEEHEKCYTYVARWASKQAWARKGTARIERKARVRDSLRESVKEYNTFGEIEDPTLAAPATYCLCQMCGVD